MLHKKLWAGLTTIAVLASLFVIAGPMGAAQAYPPNNENYVSNFMPNDQFGDKDQLSDAPDGEDSLAHLTVVASQNMTQVSWYACPNGSVTMGDPSTRPESGNCGNAIGTDSSGVLPSPPSGSADFNSAELSRAFELFWDIDDNLDGTYVDIVAQACDGAPGNDTNGNGVPDNCVEDVETDIALDDGSTAGGGRDLPTGEIVGACFGQVVSNPGGSISPSELCDEEDEFQDTFHGDVYPNDNVYILWSSSEDVTGTGDACWDFEIDPDDNSTGDSPTPNGCDDDASTTQLAESRASGNLYVSKFEQGDEVSSGCGGSGGPSTSNLCDTTGTAQVDIGINGSGDDNMGECTGGIGSGGWSSSNNGNECVFDEHYNVLVTAVGNSAALTFNTQTGSCENPDTDETNQLGDDEVAQACAYDQFGRQTSRVAGTYESTGVGGFDPASCTAIGGTPSDQDSDGDTDRCTVPYGRIGAGATTNGVSENSRITLTNTDETGTQTVVYCANRREGANQPSAPAGCSSADFTSNPINKQWGSLAGHVHLVFKGDGTEADPCHTNPTSKNNQVGDTDTLLVCTYDNNENPAPTTGSGAHLEWDNSDPGVADFTSTPPQHTDANGEAEVGIEALDTGDTTFTVTLDFPGTLGDDTDTVTKTVGERGGSEECNDGVDNDADGRIDFGNAPGNDPGCSSISDNTEDSDNTNNPEVRHHGRNAVLDFFRHVKLGGGKGKSLLVRSHLSAPSFADCERNMPIKVQIRKGGVWITRKSDTTNERGVSKVLIRDVRGKYRVLAPKFTIADTQNNINHVCERAADAKRHRHRG